MAHRTTITLTEKEYALLAKFKEELGVTTVSQAVAKAVQVAEIIRESQADGNEIHLIDKSKGKDSTLKIATIF